MNAPALQSSNPSALPEFADRLVTLCDGRPGLRGGLLIAASAPSGSIRENSCNSCLDFIASDETLDRCDEIISAGGWRLEHYRRNPVFQNAHQYGDIIFTLGKALVTEVRTVAGRPALFQRIEFAVEANPMARIAYGLYRGKFLNAVSVGFIPLRWQDSDGAEHPTGKDAFHCVPDQPSTLNHQPLNHQFRRKYLEQELLEVSAVGIPANPEALQLGLKAGAIEKADLRDLADLIRQTLGRAESIRPASPISPITQLLALAHELRQILKRS
jgi:hypothetical protein